MTLQGIDTSQWQAGLPDAAIEADFIIFKATEGVGYTDGDCATSYAEAKAAGKLLGVYHFARPDGNDPISEADWFLSQIQGYIGEAIMVLDWETEPKGNVSWAKQWLDHIFNRTGIRPMIYMSSSVANGYDWSSVWGDYGLWVAQYPDYTPRYNYDRSGIGEPEVNWPYGYAMWQWTSSGILNGWGGRLDCNVFYGDKVAWTAFAVGHPAQVPPPQPQPVPVPTPIPTPEPTPVPIPTPEPMPIPPVDPVIPTPEPAPTPVTPKLTGWAKFIQVIINIIGLIFGRKK